MADVRHKGISYEFVWTAIQLPCEERLDWDNTIRHHVSYYPEETVTVCRSCHNKLHMDESFYPDLTPPQDEIDRFYQ